MTHFDLRNQHLSIDVSVQWGFFFRADGLNSRTNYRTEAYNKARRLTMRPQEFLGHRKNWADLIHKRNFGPFSL